MPDRRSSPSERRTPLTMEQRRLQVALGFFLLVVLVGFIGYQLVEGLNPIDALYMTVITITTVGFREIVPLSVAGKLFTIGVIVAGFSAVSYAAVTAAEFVIEGHLRHVIERRRMDREIDRLRRHIIICGYGRVGRHLADTLEDEGEAFVIIDDDDDKLEEVSQRGFLWVRGDASEEHVLEEAGVALARAVVACVNTDADNVLITLTVKGIAAQCDVIARAKADENERKLIRAGADRVISPSTIGGRRIAQVLTRPTVADFLDGIGGGGVDYTLEEIPIFPGSDLAGVTLRDARIRERFECTVLALRTGGDNHLDSHPSPTRNLEVGDILVVMGSEDEVKAMREHFVH